LAQVKPLLPEETARKIVFTTSGSPTLDAVFAEEFDSALADALRAQIAKDKAD
jgi:hypothetical protein